jgi:galactokinase
MDPLQMALLCQQAEHSYAGTPCGIMDQFAVTFSQAKNVLLLDCRTRERRLVPLAEGAPALLVVNSMVKHALNDGGYKARRDACLAAAATLGKSALRDATLAEVETLSDELLRRRARHVVTENQRCLDASVALQAGDWAALGALLYASHASLRDDFNVSCAELDCIVETAQSIGLDGGVYGCRMTGGGFGGCCVALVRPDRIVKVTQIIVDTYQARTGINPVVFSTNPSAGAQIILIN